MGIAVSDQPESSNEWNLASVVYTAIGLLFFFAVGIVGGAAYKIYFGDASAPQIAEPVSAPGPAATPAPSAQRLDAEKPMPNQAQAEHAPTPTLAPPAPSVAQAAPPSVPAPQPRPPAAIPSSEVIPNAQAETQTAKPTRDAAIPPRKPATVAQLHHPAQPQANGSRTVALHVTRAAPGNGAGPYRVQFGAFANEDNARRLQWAIEATGLKIEVTQEPDPGGHTLFFLRSPVYADYAAALGAAQTVRNRVQSFVNAIPIDYAILGDHAMVVQQAER